MVRGWWKVVTLLLIGGCALNDAAQRNTTIQVPLKSGDFIAVVIFDESRHPAEDVKRWMELSEQGFYSEPQPPGYNVNGRERQTSSRGTALPSMRPPS